MAAPLLTHLVRLHHERPRAADVRCLVLVDANADRRGGALLGAEPLPVGETVRVLLVAPRIDAVVLHLVVVGPGHEPHVARALGAGPGIGGSTGACPRSGPREFVTGACPRSGPRE